jgi:hypothetical protein
MTKVKFIGNEPTKESKHIELVKYYASDAKLSEASDYWLFCELAKLNAKDGMDLIICYDLNSRIGIPYLGHWNDGTTSNKETVCTVLGEDVAVKKGKGIEFVKLVNSEIDDLIFVEPSKKPHEFKHIEVIRHGKADCLDLFFAYDYLGVTDRQFGFLYLGHLNDGFVE